MNIGEKVIIEPVNTAENQGTVGKCVAMAICEFMENEIFQLIGTKVELSYDFIYANRKNGDSIMEALNVTEGLRNIGTDGVCLESEFRVDNVPYPAILENFKQLQSDVLQRAKKYALQFLTTILTGFDTLDKAVEILKSKHMLLVSVGSMGHEMCLRGIERLSELDYKYIFRNSWGGTGAYEIISDKHFLYNNTTHYPKLINSDTLIQKPLELVRMQIDNPVYTANGQSLRFTGTGNIDTPPFIKDGRTYIPLRGVLEALGFTVTWIGETKEIVVSKQVNI